MKPIRTLTVGTRTVGLSLALVALVAAPFAAAQDADHVPTVPEVSVSDALDEPMDPDERLDLEADRTPDDLVKRPKPMTEDAVTAEDAAAAADAALRGAVDEQIGSDPIADD